MKRIRFTQEGLAAMMLLLLLGLQACIIVVDADGDEDHLLHGTRWRLEALVYHGRTFIAVGGNAYTLVFRSDGAYNGFADCNSYGGSYNTDGRRLFISELFATEVACELPSFEERYFESLQGADSFRRSGATLTIHTYDEEVFLRFRRE